MACKICNGTGKYIVEIKCLGCRDFIKDVHEKDCKLILRNQYECENCSGKGFLDELDPKVNVKMPKWV